MMEVTTRSQFADWFSGVQHFKYQICFCGHVYRCETKDAVTCPQCGRNKKTESDKLVTAPITGWIQNLFKIPELAEVIGSWQDRRSTDGTMRVS